MHRLMDPFAEDSPFKVKNPFVHPHRAKAMRKRGALSKSRDFGGRKIGRQKGHLRHGAGQKRRLEDGKVLEQVKMQRKFRTRRLYAKLEGAYRGNVRDPRITRSRAIERADK